MKINSHVHDSILFRSWRLLLIFLKISSWSYQELHLYIDKNYWISSFNIFPKSDDSEITFVIKCYTNSTRISWFETVGARSFLVVIVIVCQIASSCDRILNLNFPSDDVSVDRKWAGSISWYNCIFSISLDDDLHLQVLYMLRIHFFVDPIVTLRSS